MARILQIEDNEDIQKILFNLFSEEHDIIQAYSGTEGELLFQSQQIDLVLLDIMLPGKGGEEVLKFIRQRSSVPVIMLTALGDKHLISQYLLDGANDYIVKPFDLEEVNARVSVQLREHIKGSSTTDNIYQVKNIKINPDSFEVSGNGKNIRLGKKEFQIFHTLLQNPKKIFTKEDLYETVWKAPYLSGDNTLNAQLSNLRKKLAQVDESSEYIETIWGLGVRLKGDDL
ncbi:response regulator transcription factor [Streptococcus vestibularis]|uniref:response regulator transcription factor n=1 Tax=Streptococcus vestibularis TaxID=1343 RepID=UPI000E44D9CD|nr:response regulator transcription factor [Streptococcus vestibularis]RGM51656.1 DNA-binding response regulator [Streptococcus vestibularis]